MPLLSPIKIDTVNKVVGSVPIDFEYIDRISGISIQKKTSTYFITNATWGDKGEINFTFHTIKPTPFQIENFVAIQTIIKSCADNAEHIKDALLNINLGLKTLTDENRLDLMRMDFMKLKDRFIEYLKKDPLIKEIEEYSSNQKMKAFRKDFNQFVIDRNIYTHGLLGFLDPDYKYIIEYIDHHYGSKSYAIVSLETLKSYNQFYSEIQKLFEAFRKSRQ